MGDESLTRQSDKCSVKRVNVDTTDTSIEIHHMLVKKSQRNQ